MTLFGFADARADKLQDILAKGVVRIGVPLDAPPFGAQDASRKPIGSMSTSSIQPSLVENCSAPFRLAFMPEVPQASMPRMGVLSHRSAPRTSMRADRGL